MSGNKNFQKLLLVILAIAIFTAIVNIAFPSLFADFSREEIGQAFSLIIILIVITGSFWKGKPSTADLSDSIKGGLLWILIFFIIIVGYAFRHELDTFKKRVVSVLVPSYSFIEEGEIILSRHADGHFYINTYANDRASIKFLIDTGASGVAITKQDAINMGFDLKKLDYSQKINTANGVTYSAPIKIKKLQIGKKTFYNVSAHVTSGGLDVSLLGMSVIDDFSDFRFTNDNLILKY